MLAPDCDHPRRMSRPPARRVLGGSAVVALAVAAALIPAAAQVPPPADTRIHAVNVVPPGQSGFVSVTGFVSGTAGGSYGPNIDDQLPLYSGWKYKPFQFVSPAGGSTPSADPAVSIARDADGVPTIVAASEDDAFFGIGYAMAQDRLFQMEVFRRVGHGTLATLIGASGLAMDEQVARLSEGPERRSRELAAQPAAVRSRLHRFSDGINAWIAQARSDPSRLPAEFALLGDLPIAPWYDDDTLAFGEYAGRFFGEFGGTELLAARTYLDLVVKLGQPGAEAAFNDLFRLQDPLAPVTVPMVDGSFPRHSSAAVATGFTASAYANHDPALLPPPPQLAAAEQTIDARARAVQTAQRLLGLPRFGSNAVVIDGHHTVDGNPMLYGGPQTGFAVPGFFWEVEIHDPQRDQRGVLVPAIPLMVIGRNQDSAWTVTSGLDANSDVFVDQLDAGNATYVHDGAPVTVTKTPVTLSCTNPPTTAVSVIGSITGAAKSGGVTPPPLCPLPPETINVWRDPIHGAGLADPDASHHLFVKQSAVDDQLLNSLSAWDSATLQHDAASFGSSLQGMALCFNFFHIDAGGEIAYFHVGHIPVHPANVDNNLPMPGSGAYDWQGYEPFAAMPHDVDPNVGYLVNWNNKPATDWTSKSTLQESGAPNEWGEEHQVADLVHAVNAGVPLGFDALGQIPRQVAYTDNPARILMPFVLHALRDVTDAQLVAIRTALSGWDQRRSDVKPDLSGYSTPAVVIFDRVVEHALADSVGSVAGAVDEQKLAGTFLAGQPPAHLVSVDNLDAPTYKWELNVYHVLLDALQGRTAAAWLPGGGDALLLAAVKEAAAELSSSSHSSDVSTWNESVEAASFSAQGAASVAKVVPLPDRGSYGQVVEALRTATGAGATTGASAVPNTAAPAAGGAAAVLVVLAAAGVGVRRRRRRRPD